MFDPQAMQENNFKMMQAIIDTQAETIKELTERIVKHEIEIGSSVLVMSPRFEGLGWVRDLYLDDDKHEFCITVEHQDGSGEGVYAVREVVGRNETVLAWRLQIVQQEKKALEGKIAILEPRTARLTRYILAERAVICVADDDLLGDDWGALYEEAVRNLKEAQRALEEHGDLEDGAL